MNKTTLANLIKLSARSVEVDSFEAMRIKSSYARFITHEEWMKLSKVHSRATDIRYNINVFDVKHSMAELEALSDEVIKMNDQYIEISAKMYDRKQNNEVVNEFAEV